MKKLKRLFVAFSLAMVMILLLSCTVMDVNVSEANTRTTDAVSNDVSNYESGASLSDSLISLVSDAPDEVFFRYEAGAAVEFNYSIDSWLNADEYRITCSGEAITLLSPAEYSTDQSGSYGLEFVAPDNGENKIVLTLTAFNNGEALEETAHAYLYWSSCDCGVFVSEYSEPIPELAMAKAQYDAKEITSADYYNIVHAQHFVVDIELMNMLSRVSSDKIEYSHYAAPYVEAVHNKIFGIESGVEVPDISGVLNQIEEDLGIDLSEEYTSETQSAPGESVPSVQSTMENGTVTVSGRVRWEDYAQVYRPASFIRIQIIDVYIYQDVLGITHTIETILKGDDGDLFHTELDGTFEAIIDDGAYVRMGGYDITIRVIAEGTNVRVHPISDNTYSFDHGFYAHIANSPPSNIFIVALQDAGSDNCMKAIQVQQAAALASEFAKRMSNGYFDPVQVTYPDPDGSQYSGSLEIHADDYNSWDVIMHEYGHHVQAKLGLNNFGGKHFCDVNLWDDETVTRSKGNAIELAWGEGWATYFALYGQHFMVSTGYVGNYAVNSGTLGDDWYLDWYSIESPYYSSGEANEMAVQAILWDLTDGGTNESFDSLQFGFGALWSVIINNHCETLDDFIDAFSSTTPDGSFTRMGLGNILSEYKASPKLDTPANEAQLSATDEPIFKWYIQGGSINHPNNSFNLKIYDSAKHKIFTSETIDSPPATDGTLSFTLPMSDWVSIINTYGGNTLYWAVEGSQTNSPETGPYQSNYQSFICPLRTPELSAFSQDYDSVLLLWPGVQGATGYSIYRSTSLNGTYTWVSDSFVADPNGMSYTDTGLTTGATYYYKIKAKATVSGTIIYSEESNTVSAVPDYQFSFELKSDNTLIITSYFGSSPNIVIPIAWNGKVVTAIGDEVFSYKNIASIMIPNSITSIGAGAFRNTTGLANITIPYSVSNIGDGAFYGSSITSISLTNNLTKISADMFNSSKLVSIVIPDSVTSIEAGAFSNCSDLSEVTLSGNLIYIGSYAFSNTFSLPNITIPNGVTGIGGGAFYGSGIASISLSDNLIYIGYQAFSYTTDLTNIIIPNSVTSIGEYAFDSSGITDISLSNSLTTISHGTFISSKLTSIVIPNSITSIGGYAFDYCYDLSAVTFSNSITHIGDFAFGYCNSLDSLSFPESIAYIGSHAFENCTSLSSVDITASADCIIGEWAFYGCTGLLSVAIDSADCLGDFAFSYCICLIQVDLTNIERIGNFAFAGCDSLVNVSILDSGIIGEFAFSNCDSLEEVIIYDTGIIGFEAFYGCDSLENLTVSNVDAVKAFAFSVCINLTSVSVNAGEIGQGAFGGCSSLTELGLEGVRAIGDGAFMECSSLTEVDIPNGTTIIGNIAFVNCYQLQNIFLPNSLISIGSNTFTNCTELEGIVIPNSVTSLGSAAFAGCTSLTRAVIPGSISEVTNSAFAGCSSLYNVTLGEGIESIMQYAFAGCEALTQIAIPSSVTYIDETAFLGTGIQM